MNENNNDMEFERFNDIKKYNYDVSNIRNPQDWLWGKIGGIYYPAKAVLFEVYSPEKKDKVETMLIEYFRKIQLGVPDNLEDIVQDVYEYICENCDPLEWHTGHVIDGFKAWVESK